MGAFPPPLPEGADTCYISDHTDIALGMNAATPNAEGQDLPDLVASSEFAELYSNAPAGFYSLSQRAGHRSGPAGRRVRLLARSTAKRRSAIPTRSCRVASQTWRTSCGVSAEVMNTTLAPADAAQQIQDGLDKWYTRRPVKC